MYQGKFEAKNRPAAQPGYTPEQTREETRQAYKPHVRNGFKLQLHFPFKRFLPGLSKARRLF